MNRIYKKILKCSIIALILFSLFTACLKIGHQTPVMIDRTIGWEPKVLYTDLYDLLLLDTNDPFFQSFLFAGSEITTINPVYINTSDDISVIMEYALKVAFGENYIDNGNAIPETKQFENHTDIFTIELLLGGETCVIIDSANGRVIQCIDTRIQKQFQLTTNKVLKKGLALITSDLSALSKQEVELLSRYSSGFSDIPQYFVDAQECPIDAVKAFEAASAILYKAIPSGRWEYLGDGDYVVYDAYRSNSWLIIGNEFTLLLDKETGKKEFFSIWKDGFSDQSIEHSVKVSRGVKGTGVKGTVLLTHGC